MPFQYKDDVLPVQEIPMCRSDVFMNMLSVQQDFLYWQDTIYGLNIKTIFPRYGDSHVKDKTVARPSYL